MGTPSMIRTIFLSRYGNFLSSDCVYEHVWPVVRIWKRKQTNSMLEFNGAPIGEYPRDAGTRVSKYGVALRSDGILTSVFGKKTEGREACIVLLSIKLGHQNDDRDREETRRRLPSLRASCRAVAAFPILERMNAARKSIGEGRKRLSGVSLG